MKNRKGFTLIELLAVIVILAILLAVAIPRVTKYISDSRRDSFITTAKEFASTVMNNITSEMYEAPIGTGDVTIVSINMVELQKGGKKSPYNGKWINDSSYVAVVNVGTDIDPKYDYYVTLTDSKRYTLPLTHQNEISSDNVVRNTAAQTKASITALCGSEDGSAMSVGNIVGLQDLRPSTGWSAIIYSANNCK